MTKEKHVVRNTYLGTFGERAQPEPFQASDWEDVSYRVTPGFVLAGKGESKSQDESKQGILIPRAPGE